MTVIVVGNAAVDTTFEVERLPRPGESVLATAVREDLGGKGLNQAVAAARAGARVVLAAAVGSDAAAATVDALLRAEDIETAGLIRTAGSTDRTTVFVTPDGQNAIVTAAHQARALEPDVAGDAAARAEVGDYVLLQGNLSLEATRGCARAARDRGATVVLNPSPIAFDFSDLWPLVDIVVANEDECATLTGAAEASPASRWLIDAGAGAVVVTHGSGDTLLADAAGQRSVPVRPVVALDTTGAGDAFCGTLVAGLDAGMDLVAAIERGIAVSELVVGRPGAIASFPRAGEVAP